MPNDSLKPVITPNDRFAFSLFLSTAINMLIIFGVGFTVAKAPSIKNSLEVTLTRYKSDKAPQKADYLAQHNQEGSGTEKEKKLLSTTEILPYQSNNPNTQSSPAQQKVAEKSAKQNLVATQKSTDKKVNTSTQKSTQKNAGTAGKTSLLAYSLEMASLSANLDYHQQSLSKMPRVRRLTSLSTMSTSDAYYLDSWRRKVETVGNINYPQEARAQKIYGSLRLLVTLKPDGSLEHVEILESSGEPILDKAAIKIVKMAAPFAPFTPEMKKNVDRLEIIRTWQFLKDDTLSSR